MDSYRGRNRTCTRHGAADTRRYCQRGELRETLAGTLPPWSRPRSPQRAQARERSADHRRRRRERCRHRGHQHGRPRRRHTRRRPSTLRALSRPRGRTGGETDPAPPYGIPRRFAGARAASRPSNETNPVPVEAAGSSSAAMACRLEPSCMPGGGQLMKSVRSARSPWLASVKRSSACEPTFASNGRSFSLQRAADSFSSR